MKKNFICSVILFISTKVVGMENYQNLFTELMNDPQFSLVINGNNQLSHLPENNDLLSIQPQTSLSEATIIPYMSEKRNLTRNFDQFQYLAYAFNLISQQNNPLKNFVNLIFRLGIQQITNSFQHNNILSSDNNFLPPLTYIQTNPSEIQPEIFSIPDSTNQNKFFNDNNLSPNLTWHTTKRAMPYPSKSKKNNSSNSSEQVIEPNTKKNHDWRHQQLYTHFRQKNTKDQAIEFKSLPEQGRHKFNTMVSKFNIKSKYE